MSALVCDICGGSLTMDPGGKTATCTFCGMQHTQERLQEKIQEIRGTVSIAGKVDVSGIDTLDSLRHKAETYRKLDDWGKALAVYEEILEKYPDDTESRWILFQKYLDWAKSVSERYGEKKELDGAIYGTIQTRDIDWHIEKAVGYGETAVKLNNHYAEQYNELLGKTYWSVFSNLIAQDAIMNSNDLRNLDNYSILAIKLLDIDQTEYESIWDTYSQHNSQYVINEAASGKDIFSVSEKNFQLLNLNLEDTDNSGHLKIVQDNLKTNYRELFKAAKVSFFITSDNNYAYSVLKEIIEEGEAKAAKLSNDYQYLELSFLRKYVKYIGTYNGLLEINEVQAFDWKDLYKVTFYYGGTLIFESTASLGARRYIAVCNKVIEEVVAEENRCPECWGIIKRGLLGSKCSFCFKKW